MKIKTKHLFHKKKTNEDIFGIKDKAETIGQMKNIAQEKISTRKKRNNNIETQKSYKFI